MFRVGMKVCCVDADPRPGYRWVRGEKLTLNATYTIAAFLVDDEGDEILHLAEIARSRKARREWSDENLGYAASRFRPVVERKTDISVFREILRKASKKQPLKVS